MEFGLLALSRALPCKWLERWVFKLTSESSSVLEEFSERQVWKPPKSCWQSTWGWVYIVTGWSDSHHLWKAAWGSQLEEAELKLIKLFWVPLNKALTPHLLWLCRLTGSTSSWMLLLPWRPEMTQYCLVKNSFIQTSLNKTADCGEKQGALWIIVT